MSDSDIDETLQQEREQSLLLAKELNLRNEAMARVEMALETLTSISRTIRQSEDLIIFVEDRELEGIDQLAEFIRKIRKQSRLTPIACKTSSATKMRRKA